MLFNHIINNLKTMDFDEGFDYLVRCERLTKVFFPKTNAAIISLILSIVEG
ncbi:MAG: hypothetical protein IJV40_07290 [Oscillospiraceae bacterium]|nr:hypothetical protein [Oscillospiraceae bacterium]